MVALRTILLIDIIVHLSTKFLFVYLQICPGKNKDVTIARTGPSKLSLDASVNIKNVEVTGTANFKSGMQKTGYVFSGNLDDGGTRGQW